MSLEAKKAIRRVNHAEVRERFKVLRNYMAVGREFGIRNVTVKAIVQSEQT